MKMNFSMGCQITKMQEDPSFEIRLSVTEKLSVGGNVVDGDT